jgi:hypothetical protein
MAYWKVIKAEISEDGTSLEVSFKDSNSCETMTCQMSAEWWKDAIHYHFNNSDLQRKLDKALENMCYYAVSAILKNTKEDK